MKTISFHLCSHALISSCVMATDRSEPLSRARLGTQAGEAGWPCGDEQLVASVYWGRYL
jgi:hypothetical protein